MVIHITGDWYREQYLEFSVLVFNNLWDRIILLRNIGILNRSCRVYKNSNHLLC